MTKEVVLLDMDGVLADFDLAVSRSGLEAGDACLTHRFYKHLPVMKGAREAVRDLLESGKDVWICTCPKTSNPTCCDDKVQWVKDNFSDIDSNLYRRVIITKDKTMTRGRWLIDDKPENANGTYKPLWKLVHFKSNWEDIRKNYPELFNKTKKVRVSDEEFGNAMEVLQQRQNSMII